MTADIILIIAAIVAIAFFTLTDPYPEYDSSTLDAP